MREGWAGRGSLPRETKATSATTNRQSLSATQATTSPYHPPPTKTTNPRHQTPATKPPKVMKCELFDQAVDTAVRRYPLMLLSQPAGQGQLLAAGLT